MDVTKTVAVGSPTIVVYLDSEEPLALALNERGICADCGEDLNARLLAVFHREGGVVCVDCAEVRRGQLERCTSCGIWIRPGPEGIRLVAGGVAVHDCPAAEHDVYQLATVEWERRRWHARRVA